MRLLDVNVLVYAHREDTPRHEEYHRWLEALANGEEAFAVFVLVFSGFLRIVTHPKVFSSPSPLDKALAFVEELRTRPNFVSLAPGARHWDIFISLCRGTGAKGNLVADAYLAALAIETGSEWVSSDGDYARFPALRWKRPLEP